MSEETETKTKSEFNLPEEFPRVGDVIKIVFQECENTTHYVATYTAVTTISAIFDVSRNILGCIVPFRFGNSELELTMRRDDRGELKFEVLETERLIDCEIIDVTVLMRG